MGRGDWAGPEGPSLTSAVPCRLPGTIFQPTLARGKADPGMLGSPGCTNPGGGRGARPQHRALVSQALPTPGSPGAQKRRIPFPGMREGQHQGPPRLAGICLLHEGALSLAFLKFKARLPPCDRLSRGSTSPRTLPCLCLCSLYLQRLRVPGHGWWCWACLPLWPPLGAGTDL